MSEGATDLVLTHLRALRSDVGDLRTVVLANVERTRRVERRLEEVRDDLELMVKAEMMGRLGHFETMIEARLAEMADRFEAASPPSHHAD